MEKSKKGQSVYGEKENIYDRLDAWSLCGDWKMESKGKLIDETVGHFPKELSRAAWFFLEQQGKISGNVFQEKYRSLAILKRGLNHVRSWTQNEDKKIRIIKRFQEVIENNYQNNDNTV